MNENEDWIETDWSTPFNCNDCANKLTVMSF